VKTLVAGWFSFELMGASAGDLLARDVACEWLRDAGCAYDIALAAPFTGGVDWRAVDPAEYDQVVFVCGPFGNGPPLVEFLGKFAGRRLVGLNLTMLHRLDEWNPFDQLIERDSSARVTPDLALASRQPLVPVVGLVLIDTQPEYGARDRHESANAALRRLAAARDVAVVPIDTRLDENTTGLRSAAQVESMIARTDVVLTTRLHGTVLALKNGVPALAVDPVAGGGKIRRQAEALGWPVVLSSDDLTDDALRSAFDYCLTDSARAAARASVERARAVLRGARDEFLAGQASRAERRPVGG
jgi:hypothetical protein